MGAEGAMAASFPHPSATKEGGALLRSRAGVPLQYSRTRKMTERDSSSSTMFAMFGCWLCCSSRSTPTSAFIAATWCGARASLVRVQLLTATPPPESTCRARTTCEKAPAAIGPSVSYPKRASGSASPLRLAVLGRGIGRTADIGRLSMASRPYSPPADAGRVVVDVRGRRDSDRSLRSARAASARPVSLAVVR